MRSFYSGMTALVTGANGFVGSHVVRALLDIGARVVAMVRPNATLARLAAVRHSISLTNVPVAADTVFHLAASGVDGRGGGTVIEDNVALTRRLLTESVSFHPRRFVHCGSCFEYGPGLKQTETAPLEPLNDYGVAKSACTLLVNSHARRLPVVTLRLFTVYGPGEDRRRLIPTALSHAREGSVMPATPGHQSRDFVYVSDAVDAILRAAIAPVASGAVFNVCTGVATPIRDAVETVFDVAGGGQASFGSIPQREPEWMELSGDPRKARDILGWQSVTGLADGVRLILAGDQEGSTAAA